MMFVCSIILVLNKYAKKILLKNIDYLYYFFIKIVNIFLMKKYESKYNIILKYNLKINMLLDS